MSNGVIPAVTPSAAVTPVAPASGLVDHHPARLPGDARTTTVGKPKAAPPSTGTNQPAVLEGHDRIVARFKAFAPAIGISEALGLKIVAWYEEMEEAQLKAEDKIHDDDRRQLRTELKALWGPNFKTNASRAEAAFKTLPLAFQIALETGVMPDGMMVLNTPAAWRALLELADRPTRPTTDEPRSVSIDQELAVIKQVMNTDYRAYKRDTAMQARYRELLEAKQRGETKVPAQTSDELAELRKLMVDKASRYWRGPDAERLQARYRELITLTGK